MTPKKKKASKEGKRVVYTYGVFDLFHSGHVDLLREAKALGDYLIVGLFTDKVAAEFKRKPIIPYAQRKKMVEHHVAVDKVVKQNELLPDKNLIQYHPDILAKGPGAGWDPKSKKTPGQASMRKLGGKVVRLKYHKGISTSQIINKIKS